MLTIRSYAPADLEKVVALREACELTRPWNDPAADIELCLASENAMLMVGVADDESRIVTTAMVGHDGHRGWVYYVAVAPEHRAHGIGREIMARAEEWLANGGVPKAMLMIRETNRKVIGLYERLGYAVEERVVMARWLKKPRHAWSTLLQHSPSEVSFPGIFGECGCFSHPFIRGERLEAARNCRARPPCGRALRAR